MHFLGITNLGFRYCIVFYVSPSLKLKEIQILAKIYVLLTQQLEFEPTENKENQQKAQTNQHNIGENVEQHYFSTSFIFSLLGEEN